MGPPPAGVGGVTERLVVDPEALAAHAVGAADAHHDVRAGQRRLDAAMAQVRAAGPSAPWTDTLGGFDNVWLELAVIERLGEFTGWLGRQVDRLDRDHAGLVHTRVVDLHAIGTAPPLTDWATMHSTGAAVASTLIGLTGDGMDDRWWTTFALFAEDPDFVRGLTGILAGLDGPLGIVDTLVALRSQWSRPRVFGWATDDPGVLDERMEVVVHGLATALARMTVGADWRDEDTDDLVRHLRLAPGDEGFVPDRAVALADLVGATEWISSTVVERLLVAAIDVDRSEGGMTAWLRRARPLDVGRQHMRGIDHLVHGSDVVSRLLAAAARSPGVACRVLSSGPQVPGPDGSLGRVDADLAHLLTGRTYDDKGWRRLGNVLEAAVVPNRGRVPVVGAGAARVEAQAVTLLAERVRRTGRLPDGLQASTTTLLVDAMPAATFALAGTDPSGWIEDTPDRPWTFRDADSHPDDLPVQPGLHESDLRLLVHEVAAAPEQLHALTAAAVATVDLGVARALQDPETRTARAVRQSASVPAAAAGTILGIAAEGVDADRAADRATTRDIEVVGAVLAAAPPTVALGTGVEVVAALASLAPDVDGDHLDGAKGDLHDLVERRLLDVLVVRGWFDDADVPSDALRYRDGTVVGFDHASAAFRDWATTSPAYHDLDLATPNDQVERNADVD